MKNANSTNSINNALALSLITILKEAQGQVVKHPSIAKTLIGGGVQLINRSKNYSILISQSTYAVLFEDFSLLQKSL